MTTKNRRDAWIKAWPVAFIVAAIWLVFAIGQAVTAEKQGTSSWWIVADFGAVAIWLALGLWGLLARVRKRK